MATNRAKLTRRSFLGFAVETTTGTAATVAAADAVTKCSNVELTPEIEMEEREGIGYGGSDIQVVGGRRGTCSFEVALQGNGASGLAQWASRLLPACGWKATGSTYAWDLTDETTVTLTKWEDGYKRTLFGARGTFEIILAAGKFGRVRFNFTGKYAAEVDDTLVSPTLVSTLPPVCSAGTATFAAAAVKFQQLTINAGVNVQMREDTTDATAYHAAAITSCAPTFNINPEMALLATRAWYTALVTPTTEAMNIVIGSAANNTITIAGAAAQYTRKGRGDNNGVATELLDGVFTGSSPFTIAFS